MSKPIDVLFEQKILACSGFYTGALDGNWGPKSDAANDAFNAEFVRLRMLGGTFDLRTEAVIMTLLPKAQAKAREFMRVAGPTCKLLSGTRSYAEQDALFGQHPKVTNARGGQSNHCFGIAFDVGIFQNGHYLTGATHTEEAAYSSLAVNIKAHISGLDWGGDWISFKDAPHYQMSTGKTLTQIRILFEKGNPYI